MRCKHARTMSEFVRIFRLYRRAFPKYERKSLWVLLFRQNHRCGDIWYLETDGTFVGFAITVQMDKLVLLDFFAMEEKARGNGLGAKALRLLRQAYEGCDFILEIEEVDGNRGNREQKERRKQFYLRNGLRVLDVHVNLFGTDMELLGYADSRVDFEQYCGLYRQLYGEEVVAANIFVQKRTDVFDE